MSKKTVVHNETQRQEQHSNGEQHPMEKNRTVGESVLEIQNLSISFQQYEKGFKKINLPVIRDLNVTVHAGEMVAVVGSSGSGKSLLAHGVLGILPYNATMKGNMRYRQQLLTQERIKKLRGDEIVLVPQSTSYLDPLMKIGPQIRKGKKDKSLIEKTAGIFKRFSLDPGIDHLYPFELSGGMTRRTMISTALMGTPRLVIADEPTPGLHLSVAKRAMEHFRELADQGAGVLIITHDLELALEVADKIVVFYAGTTIEEADPEDFRKEETLRHPYSRALYRAIPSNGFQFVKGVQPYVKDMPKGCPYGPRCENFGDRCRGDIPYQKVRGGYVRCVEFGEEASVSAVNKKVLSVDKKNKALEEETA